MLKKIIDLLFLFGHSCDISGDGHILIFAHFNDFLDLIFKLSFFLLIIGKAAPLQGGLAFHVPIGLRVIIGGPINSEGASSLSILGGLLRVGVVRVVRSILPIAHFITNINKVLILYLSWQIELSWIMGSRLQLRCGSVSVAADFALVLFEAFLEGGGELDHFVCSADPGGFYLLLYQLRNDLFEDEGGIYFQLEVWNGEGGERHIKSYKYASFALFLLEIG